MTKFAPHKKLIEQKTPRTDAFRKLLRTCAESEEFERDLERRLELAIYVLRNMAELKNPEGWAADEQAAEHYLRKIRAK